MKIPIAKPDIGEDEIEAVTETMRSGWVTQGEKVEEFEKSFAQYLGVKYGVAANSGTAALHIALASLGIKEGDSLTIEITSSGILLRPKGISAKEIWGAVKLDKVEIEEIEEALGRES